MREAQRIRDVKIEVTHQRDHSGAALLDGRDARHDVSGRVAPIAEPADGDAGVSVRQRANGLLQLE